MEFKIQRLFPENPLRAYFTKYVGWLDGLDFDQEVFEYWVTETKSRFIKRKKKELQTLLHVTFGLKLFTVLRSLGRQSERLTNDYITYASTVRRIRQKLWFYHRCKDHGLVPAGLKLKSPLKTLEAIQIVKATCRRLVTARKNDCHRSLKRYKKKDTTTTRQTETTDTYWITWHCYNYCRQTSQQSDWMLPYWASIETDTTFTQQRIETK